MLVIGFVFSCGFDDNARHRDDTQVRTSPYNMVEEKLGVGHLDYTIIHLYLSSLEDDEPPRIDVLVYIARLVYISLFDKNTACFLPMASHQHRC